MSDDDDASTEQDVDDTNNCPQSIRTQRSGPPPLVHVQEDAKPSSSEPYKLSKLPFSVVYFPVEIFHLLSEQTEAVIKQCCQCTRKFRTYIPNTDCVMPDGVCVFYSNAQDECPECDPDHWGWAWNKDLIP